MGLHMQRIKGSHNAVLSGILAAEKLADASRDLCGPFARGTMTPYPQNRL